MLPPKSDCVNFKPLFLAPNPPFRDSSNYSSPLPCYACQSGCWRVGGGERAPASSYLLIFLSLLSCPQEKTCALPAVLAHVQHLWIQTEAPQTAIKQYSLLRNLTSCPWGSSSNLGSDTLNSFCSKPKKRQLFPVVTTFLLDGLWTRSGSASSWLVECGFLTMVQERFHESR